MRRQQSNAIALTLVYCRAFEKEALEDDLHNSLRSVIARSRAVHCVAFLANSAAIGCKKTPCAPSPSALPPSLEGYAGHPQQHHFRISSGLGAGDYSPLRQLQIHARERNHQDCGKLRCCAHPPGCDGLRASFFAQWALMALAEGHRIKEARSADTAATGSAFSLASEVGCAVTQPQVDMP